MVGSRISGARRAAGDDAVVQRVGRCSNPSRGVGALIGQRHLAHELRADRICGRHLSQCISQPAGHHKQPPPVRGRGAARGRFQRGLRYLRRRASGGHLTSFPDRGVPGWYLPTGVEDRDHVVLPKPRICHRTAGRGFDGGFGLTPPHPLPDRFSLAPGRPDILDIGRPGRGDRPGTSPRRTVRGETGALRPSGSGALPVTAGREARKFRLPGTFTPCGRGCRYSWWNHWS